MKSKFVISFYITWSKAMAVLMLLLGFTMDILNDRNGTVFMFTVPFFAAMITGRQIINQNKNAYIDSEPQTSLPEK